MDNLVYDLKHKLVNKINRKNNTDTDTVRSRFQRRHHRAGTNRLRDYYIRSTSNTLTRSSNSKQSIEKRQKLMQVIIATAQNPTTADSANNLNNRSNLIINDLFRIKRLNRSLISKKPSSSRLIKIRKKKSSFRIQKTYRFRNYRLRCIRLRQSQVKEKRRQKRHSTHYKSSTTKYHTAASSLGHLVSSSCAESSDSNLTASNKQTNKKVSSGSSSGEEALSLVECFRQTKFLNSSDTRDDEENVDLSKWPDKPKPNKQQHKHRKDSDSILHCVSKRTKYSFKKKLTRLGNKSLMIKENRYLNLRRAQMCCDCHYCNFQPKIKKENESSVSNNHSHHHHHHQQQQFNLNKMYLKRKRALLKEDPNMHSGLDQVKKLKLKCESLMCQSPNYSVSSVQSSSSSGSEDTSNFKEEAESSIKSDDTTDESNVSCRKFNLKQNRFKSKSFTELTASDEAANTHIEAAAAAEKKSSSSKHLSSNEEEDDLDDTGADDEQSDWPGNENSHKLGTMLTNRPATHQLSSFNVSSSANQQIDYLSDAFKVIPWWNNEIDKEFSMENKHKSVQNESNYDKMNRNSQSDNSEFDQILNDAISLMSASSKRKFKERLVFISICDYIDLFLNHAKS